MFTESGPMLFPGLTFIKYCQMEQILHSGYSWKNMLALKGFIIKSQSFQGKKRNGAEEGGAGGRQTDEWTEALFYKLKFMSWNQNTASKASFIYPVPFKEFKVTWKSTSLAAALDRLPITALLRGWNFFGLRTVHLPSQQWVRYVAFDLITKKYR